MLWSLLIVFVLFILTLVLNKIFERRAAKMKYETLIQRCKELIDKGDFTKLKAFLMSHPKQLITHWAELTAALSDYAREKDAAADNK